MTLTSYAQNFEDVILWRALKHVDRGFYIDIGAQDPVVDSVSLAFYEKGWRGVHVEPIKHYADKLRAARSDEDVIEKAIAGEAGKIDFWEVADTGLSTGQPAIAMEYERERRKCRATKVPCLPLSELLDRYRDREIHWLKIDVEGMEVQVVRSWKPSRVRPWIVVVESTKPNSPEPTFADWEPRLVALGYEFVYFDGLNRFYVSREHPELKKHFGSGPNVFDGFVLSGHASAPFCARVNAEAASLREQAATHADEAARLSKRVDELHSQAATQTETFAKAVAVWEGAHAALNHELAERDQRIEGLAARAVELETQIGWLYRSTSWRVTAPLRFIKRSARWLVVGTWCWLTLKPGSRPRRIARWIVAALANRILARPRVARWARLPLAYFPSLKNRLRSIVRADKPENSEAPLIPVEPVPSSGPQHVIDVATQNMVVDGRLDVTDEPEGVQGIYRRLVQVREHAFEGRSIRDGHV